MLRFLLAHFQKDLTLDLRQRHIVGGVLIYVIAAVFIIYLVFKEITPDEWIVLFWILFLFAALNAFLKTLVQENAGNRIYYYLLLPSLVFFLARWIYNLVYLLIVSLIIWFFLHLVSPTPVNHVGWFLLVVFLATIGLAANFTFISMLAVKTSNQALLMAALSLPVVIPLLLPSVQISLEVLQESQWESIKDPFVWLIAIDLIIIALCLFLFPFVWRD
jgi:heme exporter protein B